MRQSLSLVLLLALSSLALADEKKDEGFIDLFNGKDLAGWVPVQTAPSTWTVKDQMIICSGKPTGVMRTEKHYENFILELEWRHMIANGNSGVFIWSDPVTSRGQPFTRGIECQVLDGKGGDWYTTHGDVFPIHGAVMKPDNPRGKGSRSYPTENRSKPSPEWNHYRIVANEGAIELHVNGKLVTSGKECSPRKGYICLESEGGLVHFRNIRVKELPPAKVPLKPEQIAKLDEGFKSIYTGVDLTGWTKDEKNAGHWKADDWVIDYDGKGSDLWTEKEYGDFVMIADWRWSGKPVKKSWPAVLPTGEDAKDADGKPKLVEVDDAGDSGIYLRGSSKSQVNIWCRPCGSGEVYGYRTDATQPAEVRAGVTPKLVADAKIGEWNRFVITMKGDRLTVDLNGKRVLENAQLPGVAKRGRIALQNHGDPIQFANIYIKELE